MHWWCCRQDICLSLEMDTCWRDMSLHTWFCHPVWAWMLISPINVLYSLTSISWRPSGCGNVISADPQMSYSLLPLMMLRLQWQNLALPHSPPCYYSALLMAASSVVRFHPILSHRPVYRGKLFSLLCSATAQVGCSSLKVCINPYQWKWGPCFGSTGKEHACLE